LADFRMAVSVPDRHHERMATRLLIVDDHDGFRASAHALLERHGLTIVGEACDGKSALRCACELRPDVVLLDVQLPDIDGFEVAARLRELDDPPDVVLISSRDRTTFGSLVDESGACGFIAKAELSGERIKALLAE
jgi:DNA-binding NarL/FixJ family response regulator